MAGPARRRRFPPSLALKFASVNVPPFTDTVLLALTGAALSVFQFLSATSSCALAAAELDVNWRDSDLFNRDVDFPFNVEKAAGHVVVSAWLDFVAPPTAFAGGESTPDYPYQCLKDGEASSCRAVVSTRARPRPPY